MYKRTPELMFFLVHPGGPFYVKKHEGVWTIPKGLVEEGEDLLATAQREFEEETGIKPHGPFLELGTVKMKSGKIIHAWAFEGEWKEEDGIKSNTFQLEWPPKSGKMMEVPEADKGKWCTYDEAIQLIHPSQKAFIENGIGLM